MARCPRCRKHFRTLEDEVGMHDCPHCGYPPHGYAEDDEHECANCGARTTEMWHHHLDGVICDGCEAVRREQFDAAKANQAYARR